MARGAVDNFGLSNYAIRIWLDAQQLTNLGLTATDVRDAIEAQNRNIATGKVGQVPAPERQAFEHKLNTLGHLWEVEQVEDTDIRAQPDGLVMRVKDMARVEMGGEDYFGHKARRRAQRHGGGLAARLRLPPGNQAGRRGDDGKAGTGHSPGHGMVQPRRVVALSARGCAIPAI